jgi:hypothetical protein
MSIPSALIASLRDLVNQLIAGNYIGLEADGRIGRLTAEEVAKAIERYGAKLVEIPEEAYNSAEVYELEGQEGAWAIDLNLWTQDEGQSDLTLSVTAYATPKGVVIEIDDIHVL